MPAFFADRLGAWSGGVWSSRAPFAPILGFNCDTRALKAGECFVALKTEKRDGHAFVREAESRGASAAIVAQAVADCALPQLIVDDPLRALWRIAAAHRDGFLKPVVGITGSAGKTSTKDLLALCLGGDAEGFSTRGNFNNHIGVPLTLLSLDSEKHAFAVVEMGSNHAGEIAPLARMARPNVSIVTNVSEAHLEFFGSLENTAEEKAALFENTAENGKAFAPASALRYAAFRKKFPCKLTAVCAEDAPASDVEGVGVCRLSCAFEGEKTRFWLASPSGARAEFELPAVSRGLCENAALAVCAARALGRTDEKIAAALAQWKPSRLRGEFVRANGNLYYADCYNANPAALADALEYFERRAPAETPRLYVLGSMGELGADAPALHRAAVKNLRLRECDYALVVGAHADDYAAALLENGARQTQIARRENAERAAEVVAEFSGAVFLKGSRAERLETLLPQTVKPL